MSRRVSEPGDATTGLGVRFRSPTPRDGRALWELAGALGLDLNSPYAYVLWGDRFAASSLVAVADDRAPGAGTGASGTGHARTDGGIVGFITGFHPPADPATVFVWQVAVAAPARGTGIAGRMLDELISRTGARWLEATVTPSNEASAALFRSVGTRHAARVEEELAYPADLFPAGHEPEVRFRIGPLDRDLSATQGT